LPEQAEGMVAAMRGEFHIEESAVREAIQRKAQFNVIHLESMQKVDLFVLGEQLFERQEIERGQSVLLGGEPEYLDPLKDEAPSGWYVTGYPWYGIDTPEHKAFLDAYRKRFGDYPRLGSVVGYSTVKTAAAVLKKAGSLASEKLAAAMKGLQVDTPFGKITYRALDHQSTMGAYVGRTVLKDGKGVMTGFRYADGAKFMPADEEIRKMRPAD